MPRALLTIAVALLALPALAANPTVTLQNDSFVSGAVGLVNAALTTGEGWGATFKVELTQTPIRLKKLQGLFAGDPTFAGAECGAFSVKVYEDTGLDAPWPDGVAVFDSMTAGETTFDIPANDSALQEIDFSTFSPIWIDTPGFRVEVHAESNMCLMAATGNNHFPVLAVDADGVSNSGANFLFGFENVGGVWTPSWYDTAGLGLTGDFILRAVVETTGCTPNCTGKTCGSDGCQGSCGTCPVDDACVAGQCCTPDCQGKDCGSNGCGGSCGSCGADCVCTVNGTCDALEPDATEPDVTEPDVSEPDVSDSSAEALAEAEPDVFEAREETQAEPEPDVPSDDTAGPEVSGVLRVDSIVPSHGLSSVATDVVVLGAGFEAGVTVRLDADYITVNHVDATTIEATVPIGLAVGTKTLIVQNPGAAPVTLAAAYTVDPTDSVATGGGSGCEVGDRPLGAVPALLALALGLLLLCRSVRVEG